MTCLSPGSTGKLAIAERCIADAVSSWMAAGEALREIRDDNLYKDAGFGTFESYCTERWGMRRNYANKLIRAAGVAVNLGTMVSKPPLLERHVRPLLKIKDPEQQVEAFKRAVESAGDKPLRARHVEDAVSDFVPIRVKTKAKAMPKPAEGVNVLEYLDAFLVWAHTAAKANADDAAIIVGSLHCAADEIERLYVR